MTCNAEQDCRGTRVACEKVAAGTAAATDAASPKSAKPTFFCAYLFYVALEDEIAEAEEEGEEAVNPFGCYFFRRKQSAGVSQSVSEGSGGQPQPSY